MFRGVFTGECYKGSVFRGVFSGECFQGNVFRRVCSGECFQGSVFIGVCSGKCVQGSVFREVCSGECIFIWEILVGVHLKSMKRYFKCVHKFVKIFEIFFLRSRVFVPDPVIPKRDILFRQEKIRIRILVENITHWVYEIL